MSDSAKEARAPACILLPILGVVGVNDTLVVLKGPLMTTARMTAGWEIRQVLSCYNEPAELLVDV